MHEQRIDLAYTNWGGYLGEEYWNAGIEVCEKLMKHWGGIRAITHYQVEDYIAKDIHDVAEFRNIVETRLKHFSAFETVFFNPLVHEEPYVHRMFFSKTAMSISEYDDGKYFNINQELTDHFITVMKDIVQIKEIQELWLGNWRAGFMGNIYFLYRPEKIYDDLWLPQTYPRLQELLNLLYVHLPKEVIIETIVEEMGEEAIEFLDNDKVFVRFYGDHLFDIRADKSSLLDRIEERVESYLNKKNIPINHLVR